MKKIYILLMATVFITVYAQYDGFNYTGALNANGWTSHSGTSGETVTLTTASDSGNSLNYIGMITPVGNRTSLSASLSEDLNKAYSADVTTTAFVSFLLKVTDVSSMSANNITTPPPYFAHFANTSGALATTGWVSTIRVKKGSAANTFNIGVLNTTGGTITIDQIFGTSPADYNVGTTYFIVVKYDMTGTAASSSIWINPTTSSESSPTFTSTGGTSAKLSVIKSFAIRQAASIGAMELDEIRMGTSWTDVVTSALSVRDIEKGKKLISNTLVIDGFSFLTKGKTDFEIYSVNGILVKKASTNPNVNVDVSNLNKGIYILKIYNDGEVNSVKILKQ